MNYHPADCNGCPFCNADLAESMTTDPVARSAWLTRRTLKHVAQIRGARAWRMRTNIAGIDPQQETPMTTTEQQLEALRTIEAELAQPGGNILVGMALGELRMSELRNSTANIVSGADRRIAVIRSATELASYFQGEDLRALDDATLERLEECAQEEIATTTQARADGLDDYVHPPDGYLVSAARAKLRNLRDARR